VVLKIPKCLKNFWSSITLQCSDAEYPIKENVKVIVYKIGLERNNLVCYNACILELNTGTQHDSEQDMITQYKLI
jgi:hypothetical protein